MVVLSKRDMFWQGETSMTILTSAEIWTSEIEGANTLITELESD